jgi:hypothetical protein
LPIRVADPLANPQAEPIGERLAQFTHQRKQMATILGISGSAYRLLA